MATILHPKDFVNLLHCFCPARTSLVWMHQEVMCPTCKRVFPIKENILELVDEATLDAETLRELRGHTISSSAEDIRHYSTKHELSTYYSHITEKTLTCLVRYLDRLDYTQLISLGAGCGYEIKWLARKRRLNTVYCSDLSYSVLYVVPYTLEQVEINVGRFTSNLDDCPVVSKDIPILIYEALHHTQDMHSAIERLLVKGYRNIIFVEPTNNIVIKTLERWGVAQRVEYSGLKPGRLSIRRLHELCEEYGYRASITTRWDFPGDYYSRIGKAAEVFERAFLSLMDIFSALTNPFKFGNTSVVHLRRI